MYLLKCLFKRHMYCQRLGQPPVSPVPRPGRPPTRKPAQRQHRRPRVRSDVVTNSIHGGESGGVLPALGKERSFGDRVRGQCSPPTYPVVAVSPPPWVSPETRGGGGLGPSVAGKAQDPTNKTPRVESHARRDSELLRKPRQPLKLTLPYGPIMILQD